jgi:hypothetical protein
MSSTDGASTGGPRTDPVAADENGEVAADEIATILADVSMQEVDRGYVMLVSAILGLPTRFEEFNSAVLAPSKDKPADAVDGRLKMIGAIDAEGQDSGDSTVAEYFVHTAVRFGRLANHATVQLGFMGHCLMTLNALYCTRSQAINALYPVDVYDAVAAAVTVLRRLKDISISAPAPLPDNTDSTGAHKRGQAPEAEEAMTAIAPVLDGVRKLAICFIFQAVDALSAIEADVCSREGGPSKQEMSERSVIPEVKKLLADKYVAEVISTIEAAYKPTYDAGASLCSSFLLAPLTLAGGLGGVALLWSPLLFPELEPLNSYLRVSPTFEWVRYLLSAVLIIAMFVVMYFIMAQSGNRSFPRKQACVHAFLTEDGDARAVHNVEADGAPVSLAPVRKLPPANPEGQNAPSDAVAYWSEPLGLSDEDTEVVMDAFDEANKISAEVSAQVSASGENLTPAALGFQVPADLRPTLETLYYKLEELGELDMAAQVLDRINFLEQLPVQGEPVGIPVEGSIQTAQ